MKKRFIILSVWLTCLASCFLNSSCDGPKQMDRTATQQIEVEEQARLEDATASSPACKMKIDFGYLTAGVPDAAGQVDSIARIINQTVQERVLGKAFASLTPTAAVDSFKQAYIDHYRREVNEFYLEDRKNGVSDENLPSWYNYEYGLTSSFEPGKEGILNYQAETFEYTGGAHPNSWGQWFNFDLATGQILTLKDVFLGGSDRPLCELLLQELITEMSERLEDPELKTLEGLQEAGVLNSTPMYVSDNFLLAKDHVAFLYNKYDIAPYAVGSITLSLSYEAIEKYLKKETQQKQ